MKKVATCTMLYLLTTFHRLRVSSYRMRSGCGEKIVSLFKTCLRFLTAQETIQQLKNMTAGSWKRPLQRVKDPIIKQEESTTSYYRFMNPVEFEKSPVEVHQDSRKSYRVVTGIYRIIHLKSSKEKTKKSFRTRS